MSVEILLIPIGLVCPVQLVRTQCLSFSSTMSTHVSAVIKASFTTMRWIRSVQHSIPRRVLLILIQALVVSKVDYCNSVLAGMSDTLGAKTVAICIKCGHTVGILGQKVRTYHSTTK